MARLTGVFAASVVAGVALALLTPSAVQAADDVVLVSLDGASFSAEGSGTVLTDIASMIPGDSQTGSFFVRNAGDAPGFLRIVLKDVTYTDPNLGEAVTLAADTVTQDGLATPIALAEPCWVLSEGEVIAAGATARVDLTAVLGNLDGRNGQGATASASIGIALSDTTPGSLSPTDCGGPDVSLPLTPGVPGGGQAGGPAAVDPSESESGALVPNETELPVLNQPGFLGIDPNTWRLLEEWWILLPIASLVAGTLGYLAFARRRRQDDEVDAVT